MWYIMVFQPSKCRNTNFQPLWAQGQSANQLAFRKTFFCYHHSKMAWHCLTSMTYIYFPLSYYNKYNGGSSVSVPGRPTWRSSCLLSKMLTKCLVISCCFDSLFEYILLYCCCRWLSLGLISLGQFKQCS